ncbi:MAG: GNAT family N-acetyltransferase [Phaeodactylibacter sp.]|nr:GNAT family N-acetyltransferase [Phaeodactylibacter sp.]MCB9273595.1 GNAT family N-acetyltransferase [Lewinellaceae bacterium]
MMHIETNRLLLRWFRATDLADMLEYRTDPEVLRYQTLDPMSREHAEEFIASQSSNSLDKAGDWMQVAIERHSDGKVVGDLAICFRAEEPRIAEMGFNINRSLQGQGYATEAATAMADFLFRQRGIHKISCLVDVRNPASFHVLEKIGFRREALLRKSYFDDIDGDWFDEYIYGLLPEDLHGWPFDV